jgi:tetratricopeptide (TPR) repeat protein
LRWIANQVKLPSYFNSDPAKLTLYFCLGGANSGVQFHKHADAWNVQIFGRKRWLLYPPDEMPPFHYPVNAVSVNKWIRTIYTQLPEARRPRSCTVRPGELIYVPESWYHATLNIGEAVGVAGQTSIPLTEVQKAWNQGNAQHKQHPQLGLNFYKEIIKMRPKNKEAQYMAGLALTELQQFDKAIKATRRAIKLSPDHSESWNNLGVALSVSTDTIAESYKCFKKAVEFNPLHESATVNLGKVAAYQGRADEAELLNLKNEAVQALLKAESLA